jgi:hypothetical protein
VEVNTSHNDHNINSNDLEEHYVDVSPCRGSKDYQHEYLVSENTKKGRDNESHGWIGLVLEEGGRYQPWV